MSGFAFAHNEDDDDKPTAPVLVSAVPLDDESIKLTWTHDQTPVGGYDIIIDGDDTDQTWRTTGLMQTITGLDANRKYCFEIQARFTDQDKLIESNELCATTGEDDDDNKSKKGNKKHRTKVINLGLLQVAAHDFFNVNRCMDENRELILPPLCEVVDNENQKLDLSTLLVKKKFDCDFADCEPFSATEIANGGEFRNSENIMIFTAASALGEKYLKLKEKHGEEKAYDKILKIYHKELKKAFQETFHQKWPKSQDGEVGPKHNLALRSVHDMLPGEIRIGGEKVSVFDFLKSHPPEKLNKKEQKQLSATLDGQIDDAFIPIDFCIVEPADFPPDGICINLDLFVVDIDFAEQFNIDPDFLDHMEETSDGSFDKDENVTKLIIELFARGKVI